MRIEAWATVFDYINKKGVYNMFNPPGVGNQPNEEDILNAEKAYIYNKALEVINEENIFQIMSLNIIFTFIGVEWYFQGIEDYGYITKRSILFKIISIIFMFLFVKNKDDIVIYAGILVLALVGSNILNFLPLIRSILIAVVLRFFKPSFISSYSIIITPILHIF